MPPNNKKNIKNSDSPLFKRLTRLFSGPIINYNHQIQSRYRRDQIDKYEQTFESAQGLDFKKNAYNPYESFSSKMMGTHNRNERYVDFEQMEFTPELASALDIFADEMTTTNDLTPMLSIKCSNEEIKSILHNLYTKTLNLESNLYSWSRNMCKFGDYFLYLDIDDKLGIKSAIGLPSNQVERLEGEDKTNPNYVQFQWNAGGMTFENWQVSHFRILGNDKFAPYGTSILDPARRIWRQLCIAKGENVLTPFGYIPIEKIKSGDIVYCYDPETKETKETSVVAQKYMGKQEIYKLSTNHRTISVTDKHGMLVLDSKTNEFVYKQAKEIVIGKDKIPLVVVKDGQDVVKLVVDTNQSVSLKAKFEYNKENIMETIRSGNFDYSDKNIHAFLNGHKRIPCDEWTKVSSCFGISSNKATFWHFNSKKPSIVSGDGTYTIDKKFARLFGFLLRAGWLGNNRVGFADGIEEEQNSFYRNLLEDLSQSNAHITPPSKRSRGGQSNVFSQEFKQILEASGFETGALSKKVPEWIYSMDIESRREFIRGYFDADGSYSDGRATSISYRLLDGIREIAMMSGVPCNSIIKNRNEGLYTDGSYRQASYRIYLNMDEEQWYNETTLEKVLSFEFTGEDDTYDIQVEDELHNFIVNGMVSHNTLLEDAMMAYRITRSPERKVFYVDVGNIPPQDVEQYMQKVMTSMKRNQIVDNNTGRVDLRYNPLSVDEDYFIPVKGAVNNTKIESLPGGQFTSAIEDIKYLRDKLFAAIKIPMSYLVRGDGASEDKATLAQKDIRFARTIQRLQRVLVGELEKIGIIHLFTLGYRGNDLISFKLSLNNPSKIAALQELEHWKVKFDVASAATDGYFSKRWISQHIFGVSDEEFLRIQREQFYDRKFNAALEAAGAQSEAGGGGGGSPDFGTGGGGEEIPGGPEGAPPEGAAPPEGTIQPPDEGTTEPPDEGTLLAAPARRNDGKTQTTTAASNGKLYTPAKFRGGDKRDIGARARSFKASGGGSTTSSSRRNIYPGLQDINSLANSAISEKVEPNYNDEESNIFQTQNDIKMLIETLELNKNAKNKA